MVVMQTDSAQNGKLVVKEEITTGCWIHLVNPSDSEVLQVSEATGISEAFIKSALDEEESAHVDKEGNAKLVIIDTPVIEDEADWYVYTTIPLGIVYNDEYFITVSLKDTVIVKDFMLGRVKNFSTKKRYNLMLQVLYMNSLKFLQHLKQIDRTSHRVQTALQKSMKNKELFQLLDLEKSLVYISTALKANEAVLYRVQKFDDTKKYEEDSELLEDVILEYKQAAEMCSVYRDILNGSMDAFASIISNNVNSVMKILTIITIIISVPTLVASFWGMNVPLPFESFSFGFWVIVGISLALTVIVTIVLFSRTNKISRRKK